MMLTAAEIKSADIFLHDQFKRDPDPHLYQNVGGVVVGKLGWWVLADRHGRAIYGHC